MESKKSRSLYPNTLFHFCKSKSTLLGILEHTFFVSYAREKIIGADNEREIGVPMVSFCDIKLSEVSDHMDKYGSYGVGLSKEWANKNGLNPVLYINRHSEFSNNLLKSLDKLHRKIRGSSDKTLSTTDGQEYESIYNIYRYTKNYEAPLKRVGKPLIENYRFADEREWRYVPSLDSQNITPFVSANMIKTQSQKVALNNSISHARLSFEPNDIKYLIVNEENEIPELINHLSNVKDRFDRQTLEILKTRIVTSQQILCDF